VEYNAHLLDVVGWHKASVAVRRLTLDEQPLVLAIDDVQDLVLLDGQLTRGARLVVIKGLCGGYMLCLGGGAKKGARRGRTMIRGRLCMCRSERTGST
jgi:hypothetical protein